MKTSFVGQQDGERVLYEVKSHRLRHWVKVGRVAALAVLIVVLFGVMSSVSPWLMALGIVTGLGFGLLGWWGTLVMEAKSKSYITDRRVVRFTATTPWTVNQRSLSWDEVVKVKTKTANVLWRILGTGSVVVHARSTVTPAEGQKSEQLVTNDDIELDYVIYYQDLGNYLDKVLFLFKNSKKELAELRTFVLKPRGKRY
jgi:hypothetical protein